MVCHDDGQPLLFSVRNLVPRGNSVVAGNDRVDPVFQRLVDQHPVQAEAVPDTVRNIRVHVRSQTGQTVLEDIRSVDPVDIIVADHPDTRMLPDLLSEDLHGPVHVLHLHPVVQI